jgi:hypothetical protein
MDLKIDPIVLNGSNYAVWEPDMETLLKSKGLWKYTKIVIPDPTDDQKSLLLMERRMRLWGSSRPISHGRFISPQWNRLPSSSLEEDEVIVQPSR